jgi:hypothetical protein
VLLLVEPADTTRRELQRLYDVPIDRAKRSVDLAFGNFQSIQCHTVDRFAVATQGRISISTNVRDDARDGGVCR